MTVLIVISVLLFVYFKKNWKISFDENGKSLAVEDGKRRFEIPFSNIENVLEYSHFTAKPRAGGRYTIYVLTLLKPIQIGKEIYFTIYDYEIELIKNYNYLKGLIVIERSNRAKSRIYK